MLSWEAIAMLTERFDSGSFSTLFTIGSNQCRSRFSRLSLPRLTEDRRHIGYSIALHIPWYDCLNILLKRTHICPIYLPNPQTTSRTSPSSPFASTNFRHWSVFLEIPKSLCLWDWLRNSLKELCYYSKSTKRSHMNKTLRSEHRDKIS